MKIIGSKICNPTEAIAEWRLIWPRIILNRQPTPVLGCLLSPLGLGLHVGSLMISLVWGGILVDEEPHE